MLFEFQLSCLKEAAIMALADQRFAVNRLDFHSRALHCSSLNCVLHRDIFSPHHLKKLSQQHSPLSELYLAQGHIRSMHHNHIPLLHPALHITMRLS